MLAAACMTPRTVPSEIPSSVASADGTSMMLWPDVAAAPCQATCHTDPPWLSCRLPAVAKNAHLSVHQPTVCTTTTLDVQAHTAFTWQSRLCEL